MTWSAFSRRRSAAGAGNGGWIPVSTAADTRGRIPGSCEFAEDFTVRHGLAPDPAYVAKMLYGVYTLAAEGAFAPGTRIAAVITG